MNQNEIMNLINNESNKMYLSNHSLGVVIMVLSILFGLIVFCFGGNVMFLILFMFVAFSEICIISVSDWITYCEFEKNRKQLLDELYSEEILQND